MPRNFTYVLNQLRMDTMAQCTSPTLTSVLEGFAQLGLPVIGDVNNGTAAGAMILPSSMQPDNQTRFDAREAHFNSASRRYNLHIATNQTVTQLVLDSNSAHNSSRRVMGVEFAPRNKSKARSISCTREVIVSAGAIFTPTLLQVSGIGPSDVLKSLDILVKIDLPGVGCNLQDHPMVLGQHLLINTIAFPSLRSATDDWKQFMNKSSGDCIPSNTPNSVKKGYEFQKKILQDQILSNDAGTFETMAIS
ncbi:Glucose-methanol-choline oxidoreductase, N-terminal [Fusarium oxysporum f. sp. vasinfectum]|nr:Glucose-methanol-choline oxidoreductase, N-terminal [Fusarium oxysporum f. sp. vasinfectum]